ncbi:MAG TPA: hypothetical protein VMH87_02330 [Pseudomonadales bacterium]|nr:hypothetical protein [Pseudomonadales bacterium]
MKKLRNFRFIFALLGAAMPLWMCHAQTTFFSDNFSHGSTTNGVSIPGGTPTASSTSYDFASTKTSASTIVPNLLHMTLTATTSSGFLETEALFATNPVSLNVPGDYIEIAVVITNSANTIFSGTANGNTISLGLFNSGSTFGVQTNWPVPNAQLANAGLTTALSSPFAAGFCQPWQGYLGQISSNAAPRIVTRPVQNGTGTSSANQDLVGSGAGSGTYANPAAVAVETAAVTNLTLATTVAYTWDLRITLTAVNTLQISNAIFQGSSTAGPLVYSQITSNLTQNVIATAFDGMGIGIRETAAKGSELNPVIDISSILITGQSTLPTAPPVISQQPVNTFVTTNGTCAFSVTAVGDNPTFQWYRNGSQKLSDGGNISGSKTSQLIISPAGTGDQFTGANNGYYCLVAQGSVPSLVTNTTTNTLTLIATTNLIWSGGPSAWDVNNTVSWQDTNGVSDVFNFGQPVTLNDVGNNNPEVTLSANFLSPSSVTVSGSSTYLIDGSGSIAGPCAFYDFSAGRLSLNCVNTYTGGTLISNATASVVLQNYGALSTGPVTLGMAGGKMEFTVSGSATSGIQGNVAVADDFTMLPDPVSAFAVVMLGNLSGTSGKTLTISPGPTNPDTNQIRVRLYGGTTTNNANIALTDPNILFASYMPNGSQTFNGVISGPGAFMEKGTITYLNGPNTYSGGTTPAQGAMGLGVSSVGTWPSLSSGPLGIGPITLNVDSGSSLTANGWIFANVPNLTLGNAIQNVSGTNNCTLDIGGSQNITLTGPFTLYGNDHSVMTAFPTRSLEVTNTGVTTFTGQISDGGSNYSFNLFGVGGVTRFNNTEAYGGNTTNSGGTLLVNGQVGPGAVVVLTNSTSLGGTNASATLGGVGTITGPVTIQSGGIITAGDDASGTPTVGTLHLSSSLTFQAGSRATIKVNSPASDVINVTGAVAYNGTLFATNIGAALSVGNVFTVINAGSESGSITVAGSPGPGLAWQFNPANGQLSVIQGVTGFTIPPGITNFAVVNGTNIVISGTNGQAGSLYYLLTTTNLQLPKAQWTPISTNTASGANFSFSVTNAATHGSQFYLFSSQP